MISVVHTGLTDDWFGSLNGVVDAHLLLGVLLIGAGAGFLSGAFGKGGAAISTPLLHAIGVPAMAAIASPLPATFPAALLAGRRYARAGYLDRRVVRIGLRVGVPLTALGALLTLWIPGGPLVLATDVILLVLAVRILLRVDETASDPDDEPGPVSGPRTVAVVGVVAVIAGVLGNGGGFLFAPLFMNVLGMPVRRALGTSLILSAVLAIPGTIVHAWLGNIDWSLTLAFGVASVPFATLGAATALRMRQRSLTFAYGFGITLLSGGLLAFAR